MRPLRPGLSIRPPAHQPHSAYVTDGSEEDSVYYSEDEDDHHGSHSMIYEREPAPYGPGLPKTPLRSPSTEYTASTIPPSPTYRLPPAGTPLSSPDFMSGFSPRPHPGYRPGPPPPPPPPPAGYGRPHIPYQQPQPYPIASMWGTWTIPPAYSPTPNTPFNEPRRPVPHAPNLPNNRWMPHPDEDPIPHRPHRNRSPGPTLQFRRSRSNMRKRSSSETRKPRPLDPQIAAALKGKDHENMVLREELKRAKTKEAKREAKEKEAEFQRLKGLEEELRRYKLFEQKNQMKQEIKNEIYAEFHQGISTSPTTLAGQLGPSSGFSSEATPSSNAWTQGGLIIGRQPAPRAIAGGVSLGDYLFDRYGNPQLEVYARPLESQDVGVRGRQPGPHVRFP